MNWKRIIEVFKVSFSNFTLLLAGVVTSFVLPKFFSLDDFGYYKIFNLYTTYIIILQFGVSEGLYLQYGGKNLEDIDKQYFSSCLKASILIDTFVSVLVLCFTFLFLEGEYRFIFLMLAIDMIIVNVTNVFQYLSQAISHFTELSIRNIIKSILIVLAVFGVAIVNSKYPYVYGGYRLFVVALVIINGMLMMWYMLTYRSIFTIRVNIRIDDVRKLIRTGFPLCLSGVMSTLILSMDRQMVSLFFKTSEYAIYAFAYSLLTLALTVITSTAVVVFPMLKQKNRDVLSGEYVNNLAAIDVIVSFLAIMYFPLCKFIETFLPTYKESLPIFRIMIPGLIISSPISVVIHNYYKAFDKNFLFFARSVIILLLSIIANLIAYFVFGTMYAISYASIIVMIVWYLFEEKGLKKEIEFSSKGCVLYMIIMCIAFYLASMIDSWLYGMFAYLIAFTIISLIFKPQIVKIIKLKIKGRTQ